MLEKSFAISEIQLDPGSHKSGRVLNQSLGTRERQVPALETQDLPSEWHASHEGDRGPPTARGEARHAMLQAVETVLSVGSSCWPLFGGTSCYKGS